MKTKIVTYGIGGYDPTKSNNNIIEEREIELPQEPLPSEGVLLTLLIVKGIITIDEAVNASSFIPEQFIDEALAWEVAQSGVNNAS